MKNKKVLRGIIIGLVVLVFASLCIFVTMSKKSDAKEETLPSVVISKPNRQTLVESVTINGYVEAKAMIPVVPFVSGTIMEYPAKAGEFVTKDTLLAKIDDEPFRQQMLQAQAAYLAANKDVGAIGGRVVDRMGRIISSGYTEDADGHLIPLYQGMNRNLSGGFHMASLRQEVSAVSRHCVMLRKETVDCMDTDIGRMCRKIKERGYRIVIDPELIFIRR